MTSDSFESNDWGVGIFSGYFGLFCLVPFCCFLGYSEHSIDIHISHFYDVEPNTPSIVELLESSVILVIAARPPSERQPL